MSIAEKRGVSVELICRLTSFEDDFKTTLTVRGVTGVEGEGNSVVMTANYEALMAPQKSCLMTHRKSWAC